MGMAEYIDRKKVEKKVLGLTIVDPAVAAYAEAVLFILRHEPAADVAPVVHGQWIPAGAISENCSCCNHLELKSRAKEYIRCPICGAKMGGGDD